MTNKRTAPLYTRVREILDSARFHAARSVNTAQVLANWFIGREIVEEEQRGKGRADYGTRLLAGLSHRLAKEYGSGFSVSALQYMRAFYLCYPRLVEKQHALRVKSPPAGSYSTRIRNTPLSGYQSLLMGDARETTWKPGKFHPGLSWTHYRTLLRVEKREARAFYEIEAINNAWSARELQRQTNSLLFERLALSKDKKSLLRLAQKGHEIQKPTDIFKDPFVIEFLDLPESPKLVESDLEQALIDNLQTFLLELGKGFAFISRQERLTIDGDHFYIDLVFYHAILKCFILIDLKTGRLTQQDLGQIQLYVNYYDRQRRSTGDNPTLGLILCTDKNDAVVRYTLGEDHQKKIFASRYKLYVPTEVELAAELRRELRMLKAGESAP
jgi:predicted nuclease of restriction endonuclease-like (RecB) superfamily